MVAHHHWLADPWLADLLHNSECHGQVDWPCHCHKLVGLLGCCRGLVDLSCHRQLLGLIVHSYCYKLVGLLVHNYCCHWIIHLCCQINQIWQGTVTIKSWFFVSWFIITIKKSSFSYGQICVPHCHHKTIRKMSFFILEWQVTILRDYECGHYSGSWLEPPIKVEGSCGFCRCCEWGRCHPLTMCGQSICPLFVF
jgi:hypothetical protein